MTEFELAGWHRQLDVYPYLDIFVDVNSELMEEPKGDGWEALYRPKR